MNLAQKAVLDAAKANGLTPMEQSAEFMLHDLVQACIDSLRQQTKPYNDLGQQQQDAVISTLQSTLKKTVFTAAQILLGAEVIQVPMILTGFTAKKEIQITGVIESDHPGRLQLMDKAHLKAKVVVLLQDMDYFGGLDNIQSDKDQKPLDLDGTTSQGKKAGSGKGKADKPENKIEVAPKMLIDAREFIILQQNTTVAGLQNYLHCDRTKAEHIHSLMEEEGVLTAKDASGMRQLIRTGSGNDLDVEGSTAGESSGKELSGEDTPVALTDEIYFAIRETVVKRQSVSVGVLMVDHALPEETVLDAIERLELDEVVSPEDDMGGRQVLIPAAAE
jgi:hypothetical protein